MSLQVWTDGACQNNPGKGGWGWHSSDGKEAYGGQLNTTNNRMEMTAILQALKQLPDGTKATLFSDSMYCINGLTKWRKGWQQRKWHKPNGEPLLNREIWLELEKHVLRLSIAFKWVKGHSGDPGNEKADRLAVKGCNSRLSNEPDEYTVTARPVKKVKCVAPEKPEKIKKPTMVMRISALELLADEQATYIKQLEERIERMEDIVFPAK